MHPGPEDNQSTEIFEGCAASLGGRKELGISNTGAYHALC